MVFYLILGAPAKFTYVKHQGVGQKWPMLYYAHKYDEILSVLRKLWSELLSALWWITIITVRVTISIQVNYDNYCQNYDDQYYNELR